MVLTLKTDKANMVEDIESPIAKGKRVRSARMLAGLNRKEFQVKHHIHVNTLKSWENPLENQKGLTLKGAERLIQALKKEGIICSKEWLISGVGQGPRLISEQPKEFEEISPAPIAISQDEAILKEVQFFLDTNPNSIVTLVTNDLMSPFYKIGDYVGGYKRSEGEIKNFINVNCIIESTTGIKLICRFLPTDKSKLYRIIYLNEPNQDDIITEDRLIYIQNAAPIVWHRRKDKFVEW
jgi:DNA-binding transcriptional regulator YiaG